MCDHRSQNQRNRDFSFRISPRVKKNKRTIKQNFSVKRVKKSLLPLHTITVGYSTP